MDETPDTFIHVGEPLSPLLLEIYRKMQERQKEAEKKLRAA
jgi:hypothetical protein